jgi:arylsulfatase A-like enzyme
MRCELSVIAVLLVGSSACADEQPAARPNVLFIAIDDLNDWVGCLGGHPQVKTPHMDRLAARGTLFTSAHCQAPLCNPSRTSILTGLRPTTTGVYGLAPWFRTVPDLKELRTLPQAFMVSGYRNLTAGKVYHSGYPPLGERQAEFNVWGALPPTPRPSKKFVETPDKIAAMDWGPFPERDEDTPDAKVADWGVAQLKNPPREPFFLALGFALPHVPCYAPQRWFDLYPEDKVQLPAVKEDDRDDTPEFSWYLHWKLPEPRLSWLRKANQWKPLVRAYLASTSYVDSQIGRVLDVLKQSGLEERTLVVLWSDHGWHLGEKGITGKNSLWERSTRVPLIFAGPGVSAGAKCQRTVELLDLYPTLTELCKLDAPKNLEGHSLVPLLKDANAARPWPALTSHNQGNHAVRTEQYRYIRYADGSEELYDRRVDPDEWTNLAGKKENAGILGELRKWLPKVDRAPVPGSAQRVLTYDPVTRTATWEGKVIVPAEKEP